MKKVAIYGIIAIVLLSIGYGMGSSNTTTKTNVVDTTNWQDLKTVDEQGFTTATNYIGLTAQVDTICSKAVTDAVNQDVNAMADDTNQLTTVKNKMDGLNTDFSNEVSRRQAVLSKLGY